MESNRACGVIVVWKKELLLLRKAEKYPFPWAWKQKSESNLTAALHALNKYGVPLNHVQGMEEEHHQTFS